MMQCPRCGGDLEKTRPSDTVVRWECPDTGCEPYPGTLIGGLINKVFN